MHLRRHTEVTSLDPRDFDRVVRDGRSIAVVEFGAPWCRHCRAIEPVLAGLARARPDVLVAKLNVDDHPELAEEWGVRSLPTLIRFDQGVATVTSLGGVRLDELLAQLGLEEPAAA